MLFFYEKNYLAELMEKHWYLESRGPQYSL